MLMPPHPSPREGIRKKHVCSGMKTAAAKLTTAVLNYNVIQSDSEEPLLMHNELCMV